MDFNDATALMRLVQAVENDPYVSSGAGEALAHRHSTTTPSCRYIESHHGRKVGKHHGI